MSLTSEALHELLVLLKERPELWKTHPEALEVLEYCRGKYAALARSHGQSPDDAMSTAFELLRAPGILLADDPWGYLTHGMRLALSAAELGDALMCGRNQASHLLKERSGSDVARFGEHELLELHVEGWVSRNHERSQRDEAARVVVEQMTDDATAVLVECGWEPRLAAHLVGLVESRLAEIGDRRRTHERLRHDRRTPAILGLPHRSWCGLVTVLLGSPSESWTKSAVGYGLLLRLAAGIGVEEVLAEDAVVDRIVEARPDATDRPGDALPGGRRRSEGVLARA